MGHVLLLYFYLFTFALCFAFVLYSSFASFHGG